jgi:hypothetical protein
MIADLDVLAEGTVDASNTMPTAVHRCRTLLPGTCGGYRVDAAPFPGTHDPNRHPAAVAFYRLAAVLGAPIADPEAHPLFQ